LRDESLFAQADLELEAVAWPGGIAIAPEADNHVKKE
jgi:hypothetical protein